MENLQIIDKNTFFYILQINQIHILIGKKKKLMKLFYNK
jgi:hypothetical protein